MYYYEGHENYPLERASSYVDGKSDLTFNSSQINDEDLTFNSGQINDEANKRYNDRFEVARR